MRSSTKDISAAVFCLVIVVAFYAQSGELEGISLYFPRMLLVFLTVGSLVLLGMGISKSRKEQREEDDEPVSWPRVALISAGSIAYVAVIPLLGFYPASILFLFIMAWLLRERSASARKTLIAAALFTAVLCFAVWGGFTWLLNVPTPESILFES